MTSKASEKEAKAIRRARWELGHYSNPLKGYWDRRNNQPSECVTIYKKEEKK